MSEAPSMLWPNADASAGPNTAYVLSRAEPRIAGLFARVELGRDMRPLLASLYVPLARWIAQCSVHVNGPLVLGVAGAQGTGKSTLARLLEILLADGFGLRALRLSLDDFYLARSERERLAQRVHPLLRTRGVPGTHATDLLMATLAQLRVLRAGQRATWPRFDKASDERAPAGEWRTWQGPVDVVLFEGWCVGARAQPEAELLAPVNAFERMEDRDAHFRRYVNVQLAGPYSELFAQLAGLVFLAAPDMEAVLAWRTQQERELAAAAQEDARHVMGDADLARFVQHFERITRWMLVDAPARAQVVLELGRDHLCKAVKVKS